MTACWAWLALLAAAPAATPAALAADEVQDAVLFHPDRPLFVRLRIRLNERGYRVAWRQAMARLFQYLDTDADGVVSPEEMNRGGWIDRTRNSAPANPRPRDGATRPTEAQLRPAHTPDELADALRPVLVPLTVQEASPLRDGAERLFERLDRDGDHTLSPSELEAAASTLSVFDLDNDEMVRPSELAETANPFFREGPGPPGPPNALVPIPPREPHARLAARLIERYDVASRENPREADHKLARFELGIDASTFCHADADADGTLDIDELARFLDQPVPDLEIAVDVGIATDARTTVRAPAPKNAPGFITRRLTVVSPDGLDLRDDRVAVEFSPRPIFSRSDFEIRQTYQLLFTGADGDGNALVDRDEAERSGFFRADFDLIDRNRDGKLSAAEVFALVDQGLKLARSGVLIAVTDEAHALFDALDANHDRRLGLRELRSASTRLSVWDLDRDGRLSRHEIPQHIRVAFDHAQGALSANLRLGDFDEEVNAAPAVRGGPSWFAKMDVNHDGDLSPREFLGAAAAFRRLDRDGDGLIDPHEASSWQESEVNGLQSGRDGL